MRWIQWALAAAGCVMASDALAEASGGEPSALSCTEFRAEASRALATDLNSLQINNLLFEAARKGCVASLEGLFKAGASRLARDRHGDTALGIAAKSGRLPVVEALLASASPADAAQLNKPDTSGSTPLILAVLADRTPVAKRLIEAGADVKVVNAQGETALSAAAFRDNYEIAVLLFEHGADPATVDVMGKGVICYAAARAADRIVALLLNAGVDPNQRYRAELTALMWAAGHADNASREAGLRTVKLLLARGAKADWVDDRGRSALMIAAELGHDEIVRALIDAGANRELKDKQGKGAADLAVSAEIKQLLATP